uniref:Uncharacterized protein n=1 Tax=Tanacetum cinerariifolium TaxID=118510 RepID=A0A6L2P938_TANCI|nr:hypothetical protein [Tanacetum cinerariifolium]
MIWKTPRIGPQNALGISADENAPVQLTLLVRDGATKNDFEITAADTLLSILVKIKHEMCVERGHIWSNVAMGFTSMDLTLTRMEAGTEDQLAANAIAEFIVVEATDYVGGGLGGPSGEEEGGGNADGEVSEDDLLGNDGGCGGVRGGGRSRGGSRGGVRGHGDGRGNRRG